MYDAPSIALRLQGIENFRDFGGFSTPVGKVASGRLYRSAHHAAATDADLHALAAAPVSVVVDLRRRGERIEQPSRRNARFQPREIATDSGDGEAPHVAFVRAGDVSPEAVEAFLAGYYRDALFEPRHLWLFREAFAALAQGDGAMLIHCTAGKDRTGLLAALIRSALGGDWEETLADYEATNRHALSEARRAKAEPVLQAMIGGPPNEAVVRGFLGVSPHHLAIAFDEARARCGSLEAYLRSLGVDEAMRERLAGLLIA